MPEKRKIRLSNFVDLIITPEGKYRWRLKGVSLKGRTWSDKTAYTERTAAMEAASKVLKQVFMRGSADAVEVVIDSPAETELGGPGSPKLVRGQKRRRAGGHGYSGGDGFTRLK